MNDITAARGAATGIDTAALQPRLRRESLVFAAIFSLVLFGLSLVLIAWRTEQLLTQLSQDRVVRLLRQVADEAERGMRFGVAVVDQGSLVERLQRLQAEDGALRAVFVDTDRGEAIARAGDAALRAGIDARWSAPLLAAGPGHAPSVRSTGHAMFVGTAMFDSAGAPAAMLWAAIDPTGIRAQARAAAASMVLRALPLMVGTLFLAWWALLRWSSRVLASVQHGGAGPRPQGYGKALWAAVLFAVVVAPSAMVWVAREAARPFVTQQIQENADAVGRTLAGQVARAVALGVPWDGLSGLDALFAQQLAEAPELSYLALRRDGAAPTQAAWGADVPQAERRDGADFPRRTIAATPGGSVVVGYPADYVNRQLGGMLVDLVLALVIAAVLVRELARGLWRRSLLFPLAAYAQARGWQRVQRRWQRRHAVAEDAAQANDRDADECRAQLLQAAGQAPQGSGTAPSAAVSSQLTLLRLTVFLVALSEELLRPFFTVFASEVRPLGMALSPTMVAGLPVAAFMATLALAQPAGPALARRFDLRWSLVLSALAGTAALAATAWAGDAWTLIALRAVGGAAYGLALILVQTAIVRITPPQQRARGLAEVAAAIVAAGIVGPPFGGMIAARAGDVAGFAACALCMTGALAVALRLSLAPAPGQPQPQKTGAQRGLATTGGWRGYWAVLREPRAVCVILGAALPGRLVAVTVLSVVVPLYMSELQQQPAVAGRVLLLYFLCFASTASLVAHWSDLLGRRKPFIVAGGGLSALACLALPLLGGVWGMAACCALLGFGQALQSSPQIALATEVFEHHTQDSSATPEQALAAFRLIERGGSIIAPFVTAVAVTAFGYAGAVVAVGILLALATLGLVAGLRGQRPLLAAA
ncbi:MFS transporter [Ramlibacter sp. H39-3-26]|uniref:MFS transporter n=1 Tax=Curvibacter soli TaxID=3031331 RepID=UPI0023DB1073|nr:MFS transporter [Ramlibacter sp. H39-3-26]MDF1485552.1 MFS transporter [Ramlibacter sp. H39-3-26]